MAEKERYEGSGAGAALKFLWNISPVLLVGGLHVTEIMPFDVQWAYVESFLNQGWDSITDMFNIADAGAIRYAESTLGLDRDDAVRFGHVVAQLENGAWDAQEAEGWLEDVGLTHFAHDFGDIYLQYQRGGITNPTPGTDTLEVLVDAQ